MRFITKMNIIIIVTASGMTRRESRIWDDYLAKRRLKRSRPRRAILEIFLSQERHMTAEELHGVVRRRHPSLGLTTVYRTLKLLCESGLCREVIFEDGVARYEHLFGHAHHDHLVCLQCGKVVEVVDPEIERLQERLTRRHGFVPRRHRMEIYGLCNACHRMAPARPSGKGRP